MIDKILDMFPARNWIFDVKGGKIKPHKNGKLFAKKAIKGKQLKNRSAKKAKNIKTKASKNPGQMNFPFEGFKIKEAGGDGDCFYRSIMEALGVGSGQFGELRKSAADNAKKFSEKLNRIRSGLEAPTGSDIHLMNHLHYRLEAEKVNNVQISPSKIDNAIAYTNFLIKEISLKGKLGGTHTAPFCARALGKQIFIYLKGTDGNLKVFGFDKDGRRLYDRADVTAEILAQSRSRDRVNIWHNGANHFQAIVPNNR
jgi:hypothetical protein